MTPEELQEMIGALMDAKLNATEERMKSSMENRFQSMDDRLQSLDTRVLSEVRSLGQRIARLEMQRRFESVASKPPEGRRPGDSGDF